jgi:hypothetical protein
MDPREQGVPDAGSLRIMKDNIKLQQLLDKK